MTYSVLKVPLNPNQPTNQMIKWYLDFFMSSTSMQIHLLLTIVHVYKLL